MLGHKEFPLCSVLIPLQLLPGLRQKARSCHICVPLSLETMPAVWPCDPGMVGGWGKEKPLFPHETPCSPTVPHAHHGAAHHVCSQAPKRGCGMDVPEVSAGRWEMFMTCHSPNPPQCPLTSSSASFALFLCTPKFLERTHIEPSTHPASPIQKNKVHWGQTARLPLTYLLHAYFCIKGLLISSPSF